MKNLLRIIWSQLEFDFRNRNKTHLSKIDGLKGFYPLPVRTVCVPSSSIEKMCAFYQFYGETIIFPSSIGKSFSWGMMKTLRMIIRFWSKKKKENSHEFFLLSFSSETQRNKVFFLLPSNSEIQYISQQKNVGGKTFSSFLISTVFPS